MDPVEPMNPTIYGHQGVNSAELKTRMMRAKGQLADLAQRAQNASPLEWEMITRNFKELSMNIEQIRHALEELAKVRKKGGIRSRGIDPHIGEGNSGAKYKVRSIGHDSKGDYYISPSTGQKIYKKAQVGDHEVPGSKEIKPKVKYVPVSEDVENIMAVLIDRLIVNEAIQNNKRRS
jgi:hypothetical protein